MQAQPGKPLSEGRVPTRTSPTLQLYGELAWLWPELPLIVGALK
jgi:hypothetical protein